MELIRNDPEWKGGEYTTHPLTSLSGAMSMLLLMLEGQAHLMDKYPTRDLIDGYYEGIIEELMGHPDDYDVNNQLYAWNASYTYDPEAKLGLIKAPLTAVNTADDLMNPPELGILQHAIDTQMLRVSAKPLLSQKAMKLLVMDLILRRSFGKTS